MHQSAPAFIDCAVASAYDAAVCFCSYWFSIAPQSLMCTASSRPQNAGMSRSSHGSAQAGIPLRELYEHIVPTALPCERPRAYGGRYVSIKSKRLKFQLDAKRLVSSW